MSNGRNAQFKSSKSAFLALHPLTVGFEEARMPAAAGIFPFDIQNRTMGYGNVLEVIGFANRAKDVSWKSRRIEAYWLPWQSRHTVELTIGNDADYFFTSELNGCQFRVARTGPTLLKIVHVAGDSQDAAMPAGSVWRNNQARDHFTAADYALSRALTSSQLLPAAPALGRTSYDGPHSWTNVFGFRRWHIIGAATWDIWYQTVQPVGALRAGYTAQAHHLCTL